MTWPRRSNIHSTARLKRQKVRIDETFAEEIAPAIWGLDSGTCTDFQLRAYLDHYRDICGFMLDNFVVLESASVISLVKVVQATARETIREILTAIQTADPACLRQGYQPQSVKEALAFACKLWLFLDLDFSDDGQYLKDLVSEKLSVVKTGRKLYCDLLSKDFSQKSLDRKAGIGLIWTSDLSQHLELVGPSTIRIFRHAGALSTYGGPASSLFPPGVLTETERTIDLLFPGAALKEQKRIRRISEKSFVDIELAEPGQRSRDLSFYPTWNERLSLIQEAYDDSRPKRLKQWYWDRRSRNDWATFWIAVIVFCLTVFFGVISSVTGIIQTVIAYRTFVLDV